ncbi:hypothetical protein PTTG_08284 [Puccinia triticina 1-1 BBBD Race 1]|uniref:Uncharacterized protein n=1 Tax=Puccinia triticina (isolate 1-1 / race 1 (BBBD)) TaxID=630390 RepID=A0A180GSQ0_PUCT1|nr:hypothetical protein PTTG_08284 [Puccinia triticina 1-1 BBBD Race 1]
MKSPTGSSSAHHQRPFLVSRATNEITQFPAYEDMAATSPYSPARNHFSSPFHSPSQHQHHQQPLPSSYSQNFSSSTIQSAAAEPATQPPLPAEPTSFNHLLRNLFIQHKPSLSNPPRTLIPLTLLLFAAQLISIITTFYAIPFLIKLDPSNPARFILWIAFPLAGLLVPIYLGTHSDLRTQPSHRRTSPITYASPILSCSLLSLSFCQPIGALAIYILGLDPGDWDPNRRLNIQAAAIVIGIGSLYPLTFSLSALIQSTRSLILDQISAENQPLINISITRLSRLADFLVFLIVAGSPAADLHGPNQPNLLRKLVGLSIPVLLLCSLITYVHETDRPAFVDNNHPLSTTTTTNTTNTTTTTSSSSSSVLTLLKAQLNLFKQTIVELPIPIRRVCYVEVLNSTCWLTIFYHAKPLVSRFTLVELTSNGAKLTESLVRYAERQGTKAMLNFSIVSLIAALLLPALATIATTEYLITRRGKTWNRIRRVLAHVTPRNLWTFGLFVYAILMCSTFSIETGAGANLLISFLGLSWTLTQWVPLSLVMEYIRSIEETTMVRVEVADDGGRSSPVPSSPRLRMPLAKPEPRLSEQSPLLASPAPNEPSDLASLHASRQYATVRGGTYLAIFNLASIVPHFLITIITSTMLTIVQLIESSTDLRALVHPGGDSDGGGVGWPSKTLWLFRLTGILALLAVFFVSHSIVVPTSELDYWDEIRFQIFEDCADRLVVNQVEDA